MSRLEKVTQFFGQWAVPGYTPAVYPFVETVPATETQNNTVSLDQEDETLLADVAKDTFPQDALNRLTSNVNELIKTILPDERTQSISLTPTRDWRVHMPNNADGSHFTAEDRPIVTISRDDTDEGKVKTTLEFDFSDEDHNGKFAFEYQDGECVLNSVHTNQYGETIKEKDKIKTPLAHAMRMSLFHEALGFFQNERDLRRDLHVKDYNPFQQTTNDSE